MVGGKEEIVFKNMLGGSWCGYRTTIRVTSVIFDLPSTHGYNIGFRVVRTPWLHKYLRGGGRCGERLWVRAIIPDASYPEDREVLRGFRGVRKGS